MTVNATSAVAADAESVADLPPSDPTALADSLYYSVSHDLRSPLLTMSLSADLIMDALGGLPEASSGSVAIALDAMRHGAKDMERMLQALTIVSRARRRTLAAVRVSLQVILGGHLVISEVDELGAIEVAVDPVPVMELLDVLAAGGPVEVHARLDGDRVVIDCESPAGIGQGDTSPLDLLVGSLQHHAGTSVEALAEAQVLLERQGATVHCRDGRLLVCLPRAGTST